MISDRHKAVADLYLKGWDKTSAIKEAGYRENIHINDTRFIFGREDVRAYITEERKKMAERNKVDQDWIMQRLISIADANVADLIEIGEDGVPYMDYSKLSADMKRAISGVTIDEINIGRGPKAEKVRRIKITTNDRLRALEMIAKILDIYREKLHITSDDDMIRRLQKGRERAAATDTETVE